LIFAAGATGAAAQDGARSGWRRHDDETEDEAVKEFAMQTSETWSKIEEVEVVDRPTAEFFNEEILARPRPVVLTGVMQEWRAVSAWTNNYLKAVIGETDVVVSVSARHTFNPCPEKAYGEINRPMKFGEYLALVETNDADRSGLYYKAGASLKGGLSRLTNDADFFHFFDRRRKILPWVWFSPRGTVTPLHRDPVQAHNFHALVRGSKRFVMFRPEDSPFLYPYSGRIPQFSQVDIDKPDLEKFPDLPKATPWQCVLKAGEIIYIPDSWWHQVYSLEESISINVWWLKTFFKKRWGSRPRRESAGRRSVGAA
jgi:hypothetical protein